MKTRRSLPLSEFPRKFQRAVRRLESPRRGRRRYSEASLRITVHGAGQYFEVLQRAGLELEFSHEGLACFVDDLDERNLKNSTRLTYFAAVQAIAKEVDYPAFERRLILEDCEIYRELAKKEVPNKVRKLAANPLSLRDIAVAALKWRRIAMQELTLGRKRTYFQRSALLALLSLTPIRVQDATSLVLGKSIVRNDMGWVLIVPAQKTGFRHNGRIHPSLTLYLDDLLLYGNPGSAKATYAERLGTPIFSTELGDFLSNRTLAYSFKVGTGHSPHIVRTLVYDALASYGEYGGDLARVLCGHSTKIIAKEYEIQADRFRMQQAQKVITEIQIAKLGMKLSG